MFTEWACFLQRGLSFLEKNVCPSKLSQHTCKKEEFLKRMSLFKPNLLEGNDCPQWVRLKALRIVVSDTLTRHDYYDILCHLGKAVWFFFPFWNIVWFIQNTDDCSSLLRGKHLVLMKTLIHQRVTLSIQILINLLNVSSYKKLTN